MRIVLDKVASKQCRESSGAYFGVERTTVIELTQFMRNWSLTDDVHANILSITEKIRVARRKSHIKYLMKGYVREQ
jgi:uncharacterized protein (UPF0254 family)